MTTKTVTIYPQIKTKKAAIAVAGTLGKPSKMPGSSYGLPPSACKVGGKLRGIPGSICSECYACKGNYTLFPAIAKGQQRRLASLYHPQWVESMVFMIGRESEPYFRWHDAGDLHSMLHLCNIVTVAQRLPHVAFWLPTHEKGLIARYLRAHGAFPSNLRVRLSDAMIDQQTTATPNGIGTSGSHTKGASESAYVCPAPNQGGNCGTCRACWSPAVKRVSYHLH